jgi:hypothetical protein
MPTLDQNKKLLQIWVNSHATATAISWANSSHRALVSRTIGFPSAGLGTSISTRVQKPALLQAVSKLRLVETVRPDYQNWRNSILHQTLGVAAHNQPAQPTPPMTGHRNNINVLLLGKSGKLLVDIFSYQHHRFRTDRIKSLPDML